MSESSHPFLNALHRYSRIGVSWRHASDPAHLAAQELPAGAVLRHLPAVGLFVALGQALMYGLASLLLPHAVAVLLTLAAGVLLTASVHERAALAWWDRHVVVAGANSAESPGALAAQRTGAGTVGLVVLLLVRFETLASLDESWLAAALVCAACASRALAVLGVSAWSTGSAGRPVMRADGVVALVPGLAPAIALSAWTGDATAVLAGAGCAMVALGVLRAMARHRTGNGSDALGAMQQVTEVAWLIGMLAVLDGLATDLDLDNGDS